MNNADKFKQIFGLYATELWSMPESDFLEWLNRDVETTQIDHTADIGKKVCVDTISRQAAIDTIMGQPPEPHYPSWYAAQIEKLPAAQPATNCSEIPNGSDDTISRQMALDAFGLSEKTRKYGGDHSGYDTRMMYEIQDTLESLPAVQPEDVVGIINDSVDNALTLLDSIYSSGRMMYYSDYCALHDAIAGALAGGDA